MANTIKPFNNLHFLTSAQYEQETISQNDVYAVQMPSITPGEIIIKGFQGGLEVQLTDAQAQAARDWFKSGVKINSTDTTLKQADMIDGELLVIGSNKGLAIENGELVVCEPFPKCPTTTNGIFYLQGTVASGSVSYSWVTLPSANGNAF